jgi:RHS repeat-associated protein
MINLNSNKRDFPMVRRITYVTLCVLGFASSALAQNVNNSALAKPTREVNFTYNELGLISGIDGPRTDVQDVTTYEYDTQGRLTKTTNALGHSTEILAYNASGDPLSIKDENGLISTLTYNGFGWLTRLEVNTRTTSFEYDALGQITKTTLPDSSFIRYEYDDAHRLSAIADNAGNRIEYELDSMGNRLKTDIKNNVGTLTSTQKSVFDELSRLRTATNGAEDSTTFDYNKNDIVTKQTDALSNVTQHSYDALSRLTKTTDANNGETDFTYDEANRLSNITDAENKTTEYNYTAFDERAERLSPDSGITKYAYDEAGNLTNKTDARGVTSQYEYDALSRLNTITYTNVKENISFSYDDITNSNKGIGKLTQVDDSSGLASFTYDEYGQRTNETYLIKNEVSTSNNTQAYQISYQYNNNGAVSGITYPSGRQVNFTLNSLGLVSAITTKRAIATEFETVLSGVNYLPFGPVKSFTYGNDLSASKSYDLDYRLINDNLASLKQQALTYTKVGNIDSITDTSNAMNNQTLGYDKLSQLSSASGNYGDIAFTYDKIGNRQTKEKNNQTDSYNYLENNHRLTGVTEAVNSVTPRYLSRFNQAGRLAQLTANNVTTHYLYNYRGLRTAKFNGNESTHYHYDSNGLLIAESSVQGIWQKEYLYFNNQLVAVVDYTHEVNGSLYYVHTDYLGTPKLATNSTKAVVWQASYTPFGLATINDDVDNDGLVLTLNHRFSGQYYDVESLNHYNWHRYYAPSLGSYISSDPLGIQPSVNTFGYASGNPIKFVDILGLAKQDPNSGYCKSLSKRIKNLESELSKRFREFEEDHKTLPFRLGPGELLRDTRRGHITKINETDSRLKKNINKYYDDCGGPPPSNPINEPDAEAPTCDGDCKKVATVVAAGGGAYIVYRCIRMLPSLFPPLWGTIPANAAIP